MATYSNLTVGSRGDEVKKMQQALISAGYDVGSSGADGIYGANTKAAVQKYQQDKGLSVDGIAGNQTLGSLYGATTGTTGGTTAAEKTPAQQQSAPAKYDPNSDDAYLTALSTLQAAEKSAPTYANSYQGQLEDLYDKIVNRDKFTYDLNGDMLYQQYKDQYIAGGQLAMKDAMGQAAALTGGYGSSYGQMVGQQQYDAYLQQLNDVVPELYGMALDQYNAEGDAMLQQYSMLGDMADDEYAKYQDSYSQWLTERDYAKGQLDTAYDRGLNDWNTQYNVQADSRENLLYLITASGYKPTDAELASAGMTRAQADSLLAKYNLENGVATGTTGGTTGGTKGGNTGNTGNNGNNGNKGNTGGSGYNNGTLTKDQVIQLQSQLGVSADGKYGANSKKAAGGLSAEAAYEKYVKKGYQGNINDNAGGTIAGNGFTGTTYSEAVAYLKKNGVSGDRASNILTAGEWKRLKSANSSRYGANEFDSYEEYLEYAVDANIEAYGKK